MIKPDRLFNQHPSTYRAVQGLISVVKRTFLLHDHGGTMQKGAASVRINLGRLAPLHMIAELSLLEEGLVEQAELRDGSSDLRVCIAIGKAQTPSDRAIARWEGKRLHVRISPNELEYWKSFFLRYYRDSVAEVDHIDVEARLDGSPMETIDLMLKVDDVAPPVSAEEARRRLSFAGHGASRGSRRKR